MDLTDEAASRVAAAAESGSREFGAASLDDLVSGASPAVRLVVASRENRAVRRIHATRSNNLAAVKPGDLVLGAGVTSPFRALAAASEKQAAGLVLPEDHVDGAVVEAAWKAGVPLVSVPPRLSWPAVERTLMGVFEDRSGAGVTELDDVSDLFELCEVFEHALAGPVAIEDADFSVLAYSSGHGGGDEYRQQAILQRRSVDDFIGSLVRSGLMDRLRTRMT